MNDSALVQGLRSQDPAAAKHLSDCFLPSIWRFVYARVNGDQHLAEDIVSESVLALIRAVSDKNTEIRNLGAWLRSVAGNKVTDHFRAAARVQHLIEEAKKTSPLADDQDAVKKQELADRRAEIRGIMDDLPEQQRMALEWKYVDKLSVREIADRMETTEKAVESVLFRARRDFRRQVTKTDQQDEQGNGVATHATNGGNIATTALRKESLPEDIVENQDGADVSDESLNAASERLAR